VTNSGGRKGAPVLDEATFQKLLAAAYVLQEHHDQSQPTAPATAQSQNLDSDSDTSILAQIVEIQHDIQSKHLDLEATANLIAERILKITGAQGTAIGVLQEGQISYRAARGILASQLGRSLRPEATLSATTIANNVILRCPDASTDFRLNPELTKRAGIGAIISVPVLHGGETGGAIELVYSGKNAFQDQDVRTTQLMAGLITEALTRTTEEQWRKGLAAERASMLEVLEKIKPQLARLANSPDAALALTKSEIETETSPDEMQCQNCGRELGTEELFCGTCGTSRASVSRNDLQSKWATLWNLQKNAQEAAVPPSVTEDAESLIQAPAKSDPSALPTASLTPVSQTSELPAPDRLQDATASLAKATPSDTAETATPPDFEGAKKPEGRVWLRSIAVSPPAMQLRGVWQRYSPFIRKHRGDLALGAAALLFLVAILWAVSSNKPTTSADSGPLQTRATASPAKPKRKPAAPKLSFFEQMLVDMGLAEPPPAPSYTGNPDVPVWIDVQSALYYCPGSDLYGKTPQGRIASQRDAQQDQFEPASRRVCE
jgi:hypothetical protein